METGRVTITVILDQDADEIVNYEVSDGMAIVTALGLMRIAEAMMLADSGDHDDDD